MSQPSLFAAAQWTVSRLTRHLSQVIEADPVLQDVWVRAEVSNLSRPASGHIYFTLKDAGASLKAVMWKLDAARLPFPLKDGMAVEAHGRVGIYEVSGQYQLYVDILRPVGEGALYAEFMRLKSVLEAEGLFDPDHKRPIPDLPGRIGIVTSATGAALRDMLNTLRRRLPLAEVILAPSPVQGAEAPPALVKAIQSLSLQSPDVILIARGGGSIEDLWAFNDERVVRAVAESDVPIISGVGHETDFTLTDFAADLRAPTPTAAAELATSITIFDLRAEMENFEQRSFNAINESLNSARFEVSNLQSRILSFSPSRQLQSERQHIDELSRLAMLAQSHRLTLEASQMQGLAKRLVALNPFEVLARGYAVVTKADGSVIRQLSQVGAGADIRIRVTDGEFDAKTASSKS